LGVRELLLPLADPLRLEQEAEGRGQDDRVAEDGSGHEADGARDHEGKRHPPLVGIEPRRDESPELVKEDRHGEKEAGVEAHLDEGAELLHRRGLDQRALSLRKRIEDGPGEETEDLLREDERERAEDEHGQKNAKEPLAELAQMLPEAHAQLALLDAHGSPLPPVSAAPAIGPPACPPSFGETVARASPSAESVAGARGTGSPSAPA